jgi:hypothetical protein
VFRSPRVLAMSYFDPYVDFTGSLTGYAVADLRQLGNYDWRFSRNNVWAVERFLLEVRHTKLKRSPERVKRFRRRYRAYMKRHGKKPLFYRGRGKWTEIPRHFL